MKRNVNYLKLCYVQFFNLYKKILEFHVEIYSLYTTYPWTDVDNKDIQESLDKGTLIIKVWLNCPSIEEDIYQDLRSSNG